MKFAFCLFKYFPYGGLQRDFLRIARTCIERGHMVHAFCLAWQGPVPDWLPVTVLSNSRLTNHGKCQAFSRSLKPILDRGGYDLVAGFDKMPGLDVYYAADPCYRARAKRTHSWLYRLTRRYRHFLSFEQAVFDPAVGTEILAISAREQSNYERHYGTPSERFNLLPPGITRDYVPPENVAEQRKEMRKRLGANPNEKIMLFVGSDFKRKGLDRALQAMAKLPSHTRKVVQLHILGPDNKRPFQRMAKRLSIQHQVRFWGGQDNAPLFFWGADLLIHPAYEENTGTVLLDALVSGLPVLTTDVCGYAHHIDAAQAGFVVPSPFSIKALAARLEEMMSTERREFLARNARKYASTRDLHSLPQKAADLIERFALRKEKGEREA